jgi:hypothetical protein
MFPNISIPYQYPYWTALHRPASTCSVKLHPPLCRMTFIVTIRIWSRWKWAEWVVIYATVTHSRILNRVHTELKPYRPGSTRTDPVPPASYHASIPEDSGGYNTAEKTFWSCSKFLCVWNRVEIRFKSFSTPIDPDVRPCHTPLHEGQCSIRQESMQFYIAGWCWSMRLEPGQYRYQYGIKIRVKILNMTKTVFSAVSYSRNPSRLDSGYDAGLYGWNRVDTVLIPYGPGSKSGCVWLHSRNADLIVNCFDPF